MILLNPTDGFLPSWIIDYKTEASDDQKIPRGSCSRIGVLRVLKTLGMEAAVKAIEAQSGEPKAAERQLELPL
jgi:hypothetical protein